MCLASRLTAGSRSFAGTTRVRILAETLQALDAAHDDTLITLLHCLRCATINVSLHYHLHVPSCSRFWGNRGKWGLLLLFSCPH